MLLGWVNCSDKYLRKYSEVLSELGYSSVRSIQPTLTAFSLSESPRRVWARNILELLIDTQGLHARLCPVYCTIRGMQKFSLAHADNTDGAGQWYSTASATGVAGCWNKCCHCCKRQGLSIASQRQQAPGHMVSHLCHMAQISSSTASSVRTHL